MTLGSKLPAFSASRQLTSDDAAADGRRGDIASKHYSGVRAQRRKVNACHTTAGTRRWAVCEAWHLCTAEWFISQHSPTGQNLGGRITLASPLYQFWGDASPHPPGVYAYASVGAIPYSPQISVDFLDLVFFVSVFDYCIFLLYVYTLCVVGWVFWPVKTVACITYTVLVET